MSSGRASQLVEAGLWLRLSGDHEGARRLFEQALKLEPANARARQLLDSAPATKPVPEEPAELPGELPAAAVTAQRHSNPFERHDPPSNTPSTMEADWGLATGFAPPPPPANAPPPAPFEDLELVRAGSADDSMPAFDLPPPPPPPSQAAPLSDLGQVREFTPGAKGAWDSNTNPGMHLDDVDRPGVGSAMDLVTADFTPLPKPSSGDELKDEVRTLLDGAKDLLELDDHTGAMELIAKAQHLSPSDPEVAKMRDGSERTLEAMLESKLGNLDAVPRVKLKEDEIIWLNLDHRAGFVLAQIDGTVTFEDVFAVSGMSRLDTARILAQLVEEGVIVRG